jgi:hypothetical protein
MPVWVGTGVDTPLPGAVVVAVAVGLAVEEEMVVEL